MISSQKFRLHQPVFLMITQSRRVRMKIAGKCILVVLIVIVLSLSFPTNVPVFADSGASGDISALQESQTVEVTLLGPNQYTRTSGKPNLYTDEFPGVEGIGRLIVENGHESGESRVSSALVTVNEARVLGPRDFNLEVGHLETTIDLHELNEITVELRSTEESFVTVSIVQQIEAEAAAVIGPEGGTIEITDPESPITGFTLEIPEGALDTEQLVTAGIVVNNETFGISPMIDLGPSGLVFNQSIVIGIPYDDCDVVNNNIIDESLLGMYHLDEDMALWIKESESVVDTENNMIWSTISHFSYIGKTGDQLINVNAVVDPSDPTPDAARQQVIFLHGVQIPFHKFWIMNWDRLWNILTFKGDGYGNYEDTFGCAPALLAMDPEKRYQVWAINYDSWDPIENKGRMLGQAISKIKNELGDPDAKVSIIAHSMGGLVARWHIQRPLYPGDVSKVIMTGCPNHGAYLANVADFMLDVLKDKIAAELGYVPGIGTILAFLYSSFVDFAPSFEQLSVGSDFLAELNDADLKPIPGDVFIFNVYTDNLQLLGLPFAQFGDGVVSYQSALLNEFDPRNTQYYDLEDYWHVQFSLLGWNDGIAYVDSTGHLTWEIIRSILPSTELYYDDGSTEFGWATSGSTGGVVVRFTPPTIPWTLSSIKVQAWYVDDDAPFYVEIWDKDRNELFVGTYMYSDYFTSTSYFTWAEIDISDILLTDDFYVCVFPNDTEDHTLWMCFDDDPPISNRSHTAIYTNNFIDYDNEWDWMIRAVGHP